MTEGVTVFAWMVSASSQFQFSDGLLGAFTIKVALGKVSMSFGEAFVSGILCNFFVCIAVLMAAAARDIAGKVWAIFFPIMAFVVSGIIAAFVGLLLLGYLNHASKDMASNYVMPSIVAVVVGGISINGGEGNYLAVVLGAVVLQSLTNLFVALGWGDAGKWLVYALILLVMLAAYIRNKRKR